MSQTEKMYRGISFPWGWDGWWHQKLLRMESEEEHAPHFWYGPEGDLCDFDRFVGSFKFDAERDLTV